MTTLAQKLSTFGPIGYYRASGTIASAIIFLVGYLLTGHQPINGWALLLVLIILIISTQRYSSTVTEPDPHQIISDEVIASLLLIWLIPHSIFYYLLAFAFFRFFDIKKPLGIKSLERLPGAYGIIADDLLAGFYALIIIRLIQFVS
jgi:phosphatidylglycerophosphatase A